jgi:hypothetical protein
LAQDLLHGKPLTDQAVWKRAMAKTLIHLRSEEMKKAKLLEIEKAQ